MQFWLRRIKSFVLDFETTTTEVMEVFHQLLDTSYDLFNGPLWKARLVVSDTEEKAAQRSAVLIFSVQHSITDGTSNMHICREFVSILNKITKGQKIKPIPISLTPAIDNSVKIGPRLQFLAKYLCTKPVSMLLENYRKKSSFNGILPVPKTKNVKTKVFFDDFTKTETENLIRMCRENKITVNSFITTIANFALLKTAQSFSNKSLGKKNMHVGHTVNMRRYFDNQEVPYVTGCHVSVIDHKTKMSLADAKDFWDIAKIIHHDIKDKLEVEKLALNIVPVLEMGLMFILMNNFLIKKGLKNVTSCHYGVTNMGNLKDLLPEPKEDDDIEISYILRSASAQILINPFALTLQTFRGRLLISVDYYTNKLEEEVVQEFFKVLCQYIRNIVNLNSLEG